MKNYIVNNNGSIVGWLNDHDNTILGKDGNVKFYLYGNKLVSKRDGKVYTVQNDGRIIDSCNMQIGFFYGFTSNKRTTVRSSNSKQSSGSSLAEGLKAAGSTFTKAAKKTAETFRNSRSAQKIGIFAVIFVVLVCMITPLLSGIKGTWVIDRLIEDGVSHSIKEYEAATGEEFDFEIHARSDNTLTLSLDGRTVSGTYYKSSGNKYVLEVPSSYLLNIGVCSIVVEKRNGKLYFVEDGVTLVFKRG